MIGSTQILLLVFLPWILFIISIQNTLKIIRPQHRTMKPSMVWLSLIPLFGLIWQFNIVKNIALSLQAEFKARNIKTKEILPGQSIGVTYAILFCCSLIPKLGSIASLAGLICWIIYWVKIIKYRKRLEVRPELDSFI